MKVNVIVGTLLSLFLLSNCPYWFVTEYSPSYIYEEYANNVFLVFDGTNAAGTSFLLNYKQQCFLVTNFHVIKGSGQILLSQEDSKSDILTLNNLEIYSYDAKKDIAVLVNDNLCSIFPKKTFKIPDFDKVKTGDKIFALGYPLAYDTKDLAITDGIISLKSRYFHDYGGEFLQIDTSIAYIQHTAILIGGSSGGPLITSKGEVVGMNTFYYEENGSQIYFAIPIPTILSLIDQGKGKKPLYQKDAYEKLEDNDPSTTQNIMKTNGESQLHTLYPVGDVDYIRFKGEAFHKYTISTFEIEGDTVLTLYEYGRYDKFIAENDDYQNGKGSVLNPDSLASQITFIAPANIEYVIKVYYYENKSSATNLYNIKIVDQGEVPRDAFYRYQVATKKDYDGINDSWREAKVLLMSTDGCNHSQLHSLFPINDIDWFALTLKKGEKVELLTYNVELDTHIFLYGPNNADMVVAENDDAVGVLDYSSKIIFTPVENGVYYLKVIASVANAKGMYSICAAPFKSGLPLSTTIDPSRINTEVINYLP